MIKRQCNHRPIFQLLIQMGKQLNPRRTFLMQSVVFLILINGLKAGLSSVSVSSTAINSIATYTWAITFNAGTPYNPLTLTFPTQVTLLANCTVTINSVAQTFSISANTLTITSNISLSTVSIVVGNVKNPSSAISSYAFSYTNPKDGTVSLDVANQVQYQSGTLSGCPWSFLQCTESPLSDLLISITTINTISAGTNYFLIGYSTTWPNHYSKGLVTSVGTLTCSYSTNNGSSYTVGSGCTIDTSNLRIVFQFSSLGIAGGSNILIKVSGVNAPPTMQTSTSSSYFFSTADSSLVKIDGLTSCVINNVCITNQTSGSFFNTTMNVNANYGIPQVTFPIAETITLTPLDTIDVVYSPFSSVTSCTTLRLYRSGSPLYTLTSPTTASTYITFTFPSTSGYNTQYTFPFTLILTCTSFLLPPSETPTTLAFIFKRNSDTFMHLNATVAASATTFNSLKATLTLSTTSMASASFHTFNFLIGQPLGSKPAFLLTFSTDYTISSPSCSATVLTLAVSSTSCSYDNTTSSIRVELIVSSALPVNSNVSIVISSGLTNPSTPKSYAIGMSTYYDSNVSSSRVQTSSTAFTTVITEITNYPVSLSPSGLTVYTSTNIILSFVTLIPIPAFSTFYIQFPSAVSSILTTTSLLTVGGTAQPLNSSVSVNSSKISFLSGATISKNSSVSITIQLTTPSNIGTYSYVKFIVSNNGSNYLSTTSALYLNVNSVSSMSLTVTALTSIAGATSNYMLTLVLTIPHNTTFIVQVDVPTDTTFISTNASCTNCIASSLSPTNATTFTFTASNPSGANATSIVFTLSSFTNPRSAGSSLPWGVSTKTVSPTNLISYSSASASILNPNGLTAVLSKSDSYYRNNSNPLKITFTFTNRLIAGDYILLSFTSDSYTGSSVTCSSIYGSCAVFGTPSNVTVVKIFPNTTSIIGSSLFLILEGLTSNPDTAYGLSSSISVTTLTNSSATIDSGSMTYNISCGVYSNNLCKQCYNNGTCINCYSGYYLHGTVCVSSCGAPTLYFSYANSTTGICTTCINNCKTCDTATACRSCISGYYYYTTDSTCRITCSTTSGYYAFNGSCLPCISNCLQCVNGSNSCTRCDNTTLLISGSCQNGCGSTNYYQQNGNCLPCDASCYNCSGAGSGSCYTCSANYHRYITQCVAQCPNGTAINPSTGDCGCDVMCLTCSTYTACTTCLNVSEWVLNGGCISSCPLSTYANAGQCVACSTGCLNCTINTCTTCISNQYLFNNSCYSDCNLISQQYDALNNSCVLCPSGCDRCSGTICTSCLDAYTLNNTQCIKTCLLSNTCEVENSVLPVPGVIALVLWTGICVAYHLIKHQNYLPYSIIIVSSIVQYVLVLALTVSLGNINSPARLLASTTFNYKIPMAILLIVSIALNYTLNAVYAFIFVKYIKPLITNARQIDVISNVTVIIIAALTNYRFGLLAFARMFPKPYIYIPNASKLTPIHYLCLAGMFLEIVLLAACGLGLSNSQKLSTTYMLSVDLTIVVVVNWAITIWFVAVSKPDSYFEDAIKKYNIQENGAVNPKEHSKAKIMNTNESLNFDDNRTEFDEATFNKFGQNKNFNGEILMNDDTIQTNKDQNPLPITVFPNKTDRPSSDPNFQPTIKSKKTQKLNKSKLASQSILNKQIDNEGKSIDENIAAPKIQATNKNFSKSPREPAKSQRKKIQQPKNIIQVEESDYPDLQENSDKGSTKILNTRQRPIKAKKLKESKKEEQTRKARGLDEPLKVMKKGDKRIGYFQSDAYESNADGEDIEQIIKQKIWQSTIKIQKPVLQSGKDEETGHQEISPSWFNVQNQRLDITDLEDADPE